MNKNNTLFSYHHNEIINSSKWILFTVLLFFSNLAFGNSFFKNFYQNFKKEVLHKVDNPSNILSPFNFQACTAESEHTAGTPFADNSCGGSESTITFNVTDDLTITDLNLGLNISVLTHRHHFQVVLTSPTGTSVTLVTAPKAANFNDNIDILLDSDGSGPILDADDDDLSAPYYDRVAIPDNSLDAFDGENAMGTWTMTICDDNNLDDAIGGTVNRAKLFFEGDCPEIGSTGTTFSNATYTINTGGTINTCSGTFADAGDTNGNYSDGEAYTMTFCSDLNNHISFTFEHFNTEIGLDALTIYDGNSIAAPQIAGYSGTGSSASPGVVTSSGTCLTFTFSSNGSTNSTGWLASISCTGLPTANGSSGSWSGYPTDNACGGATEIGGTVYEDIDNDGEQDTRDPGILGTIVTLFDDNGQVGSPLTTDANGNYTFTGLTAATVYRLEFTVPDGLTEGAFGSNSGTAVQYIESGRCDANLGLADAAHYCHEPDPFFVVPCYANGDPLHSDNIGSTGIAQFKYSDSGDSPASTYVNYVTVDAIGTTWGVGYDGTLNKLYTSSVLKRHAGLGPNGIGAIYQYNGGDPNNAASVFYDFGSSAGIVADNATRFPGAGALFGEEGACGVCDNIDPSTFAQIGKAGFGDIDINPLNSKLYATNLFDRKIYTIDLDNPTAGSATPLPNIPWLDNSVCSNGVARPWGLEFRRGKLYVGVVCDASLSSCTPGSTCSDLSAEIYSFDGTNWTNVLSFSLDYYRDAYAEGSDYFVKWIDNWNDMSAYVENVTDANFAQPIIMDLEFDDDNSLIIGIGDRSGFQMGYRSANPTANSNDVSERNFAFGDVLRASFNGATGNFTLENNGSVGGLTTTNPTSDSGPGGKSFYWGDFWTGTQQQSGIGPLALLPGSGEIMFPMGDAVSYYANGISWMNSTNGSDVKRLEVYQGTSDGNSSSFAKSSGLGDMELLCNPRPLEIGNIIWWDDDLDGLQDPSEQGINGVTLELYKWNGTTYEKVAETSTDAYGRYVFSQSANSNGLNTENWSFTSDENILANTQYQIRLPNWNAGGSTINTFAAGLGYSGSLISPNDNQGSSGDKRDNDAIDNAGNAVITLTTGIQGDNNHSYDFGFGGIGGCDAPEVIPTANAICHGETLNLMAAISGGSTPYSYNWSGPNSFNSTIQNPSIANADSALYAGIYYLTVTDNMSCEDTTHIHVAINKVSASATATDATCGTNTGAIDLTVDVGLAPFSIDWDNDGTGDNDDTEDLTGLASGAYNVTVTDSDGCTTNTSASVDNIGSVALSEAHVDETCTAGNGSIDLTITGAHTTIDWNNDGTGDNDDTEDLSGLSAGTYSVTVNNASNCPATLSITLTDTTAPNATATSINTTCGGNNGSIDLTVSGGVSPFTYDWDNDGMGDNDDAQDLTDLSAGAYNVTVTDATGCTANVAVNLTDTAGPTLSASPTNEVCGNANGSIDLTVNLGTAPYTYAWSNGLTTADISGLGAGTFTVTVTDANGCMATTNTTVSNLDSPTVSLAPTNATDCNTEDGSIILTVTGGMSPYTYDWDNDGFEAIDDDTKDLIGLASGSYTVIVTDANGCTTSVGTSVLNTNDANLSISETHPTTCLETGSLDLTITTGTPPFIIDWNNDGLGDNDDTEDLTGLTGGGYTVIVTDAHGCSVQENASIQVIRNPILVETIVHPSCGNTDGSVNLTIEDQDGSGPYTIDWNNDGIGDNDDTQNQSSLSTGNYSVTITNSIACSITETYNLSPTTAAPSISLAQSNPTCGNSNGAIDMTITGGTMPFTIDWDNDGIGDNDDMEDLTGLSTGIYNVTITDNGGCQAVGSSELLASKPPSLNAIVANEDCTNGKGAIRLMISGIAPFTIDWDNDGVGDNDDSAKLSGLSAGIFSVTVTDGNACSTTKSFTVKDICNFPGIDYPDYYRPGISCTELPCHTIYNEIYLGSGVTADSAPTTDSDADTDVDDGISLTEKMQFIPGNTVRIPVSIYNNTGNDAYLRIWIDWNGDEDFEDSGEQVENSAYPAMGTMTNNIYISVTVPQTANQTKSIALRARLSTDDVNSATPCGTGTCAADGEIEDYLINVSCPQPICPPVQLSLKN